MLKKTLRIRKQKNIKTDSLEILKTLMCKLVEGADCLKQLTPDDQQEVQFS